MAPRRKTPWQRQQWQHPTTSFWNVSNAVVASRALQVIADLGVADHIGAGPVPVDELAHECNVRADALNRALRLLTTYDIFELTGAGYGHTDASRLLRTDHPMSMRAFAQLNGLPGVWGALGALDHSLSTGAPGWEKVDSRGFFPYLQEHPREAAVFDRAMSAKAGFDIATILDAYDFRPYRTVADIAGGRGHLLQAVLGATAGVRGILFEQPDVTATLDIASDRLHVITGDFFTDALPEADCYILMEVIHDWPDEEATRILQAIRAATHPGATVLVIEGLAPDHGVERRSQTLDVLMLSVTGGRERSAQQHAELFRRANIQCTRVVETSGPMRIVEGAVL
jgi:hypothetical protein